MNASTRARWIGVTAAFAALGFAGARATSDGSGAPSSPSTEVIRGVEPESPDYVPTPDDWEWPAIIKPAHPEAAPTLPNGAIDPAAITPEFGYVAVDDGRGGVLGYVLYSDLQASTFRGADGGSPSMPLYDEQGHQIGQWSVPISAISLPSDG